MCTNIEEEEGGEGCVSSSSQHMGDVLTCEGPGEALPADQVCVLI